MLKQKSLHMKKLFSIISMSVIIFSCSSSVKERANKELKEKIINDESLAFVKSKALEIVKTGFNAGDGYGEVWIRDYNTFIELSGEVYDKQTIKENLLVFLRMQGKDGNIIDGFIPREK